MGQVALFSGIKPLCFYKNGKPCASSKNPDFVAYSSHESEPRYFELCLLEWHGGVSSFRTEATMKSEDA